MYEFIRGVIADLNPANVIIENGGVGYFINISLNSYSKINGRKETLLYIHQVVREDAHILYGFAEKNERELFRNLISVNGVGAGTAVMMLSSLNPDEIIAAVTSGNTDVLTGIKGIGANFVQQLFNFFGRFGAETGKRGTFSNSGFAVFFQKKVPDLTRFVCSA